MKKYSIKLEPSHRAQARAFLLEDGIQIAVVSRSVNRRGIIQPVGFRWFTTASEKRFMDFCDSISMSECVEALGFPASL